MEYDQIDAAERAQQARVAAVATGKRGIVEQAIDRNRWSRLPGARRARDALVEDGAVVTAGLVAERAAPV